MGKIYLCFAVILCSLTVCLTSKSKQEEYEDLMRKLKVNFLNQGLKQDSSELPPPIDLVFLVDESSCMGKTNYIMSMRLIKKLLDFFSISPGTTRVGLITYADVVKKRFDFTQYANRKAAQKSILKLSLTYSGKESSYLGRGLSSSIDFFKTFTRPNTKRILVTISNGAHGNNADAAEIKAKVAELETLGVKRYVFTVGQMFHATNIQTIVSKPTGTNGPQKYHFLFKSDEAIRWVANLLPEAYYTYCNKPGTWKDECHRKCECVNGHILNCQRVREEVTSMTVKDRKKFIDTYRKLTSIEPYKSHYNRFISIHSRHFFDGIHESLQFLPWHRWFLTAMEDHLLTVDCRVTYPYWDWSLVAGDPWNPTVLFGSRPDLIGGIGDFEQDPIDGCVVNGPFGKGTGWRTQAGMCLRRDFFSDVPDLPIIMDVLSQTVFQVFEVALRVNLHDAVHCAIGGTMCSLDSATVPEFFMHHGYVDKLWEDKQKTSAAFRRGIFNPPVGPKVRLSAAGGLTADQFLDNEKLPGYVNVTYARPLGSNARMAKKICDEKTVAQLLAMRRKGNFTLFSEKAAKHFKLSDYDRKMAMAYNKENMEVLAKHKLTEKLTGDDKLLGFKIPDEFKSA